MKPQYREKRLAFLAIFALILIIGLSTRLGFLEVAQGAKLRNMGVAMRVRVMPIMAPRGQIVDSGGQPMATNMPSFSAEYFDLGAAPPKTELHRLATILHLSETSITTVLANYRGQPYIPVQIKADLTPQEVTLLEEDKMQLPNVFVQAQPLRVYPMGVIGAHVLGYVQGIFPSELKNWRIPGLTGSSIVGQTGLEFQYEKYLQGTDGGEEVEVDEYNRPVKVLGNLAPVPGDTLHLTISKGLEEEANRALLADLKMQQQVYNAQARSGAVIVMNVHTGGVLAMTSVPSFNPNWFAQGMTAAQAQQVFNPQTNPLLNRAISAQYPPGSTYKMATAISGLESGSITTNTLIDGLPRYWYAPFPWNWIRVYTGWNDVQKAIAQSNDIFFYETARRTGIDTIAKWATKLGFGQTTGIDLPGEATGNVPTKASYEKQNGGAWYPGLVYSVGIGQGEDLATLIQLADYAASLSVDGVRYKPYLVQEITTASGKVVKRTKPQVIGRVTLTQADWQAIHAGMHGATVPGSIPGSGGTAGGFFVNFPMQVAGKTGTAQVAGQPSITWFVSYAPLQNPQIAVAVEVAGGVEGAESAPVARDLYDYYFHLNDPGNILAPPAPPAAATPTGTTGSAKQGTSGTAAAGSTASGTGTSVPGTGAAAAGGSQGSTGNTGKTGGGAAKP